MDILKWLRVKLGMQMPDDQASKDRGLMAQNLSSAVRQGVTGPEKAASILNTEFPLSRQVPPSATPTITPTPYPTPVPGIKVNPQVEDFLTKTVLPITRKYGLPDAVVAGQYAAEGRGEGLGARRNNFFNLAAVDSNPNNAFTFDTPEQGIDAYAKYVSGQLANSEGVYQYPSDEHRQKILNAYAEKKDPLKFIKGLTSAGYAGDPATYPQRTDSGYQSYDSFVSNTPEYKRFNYTPTSDPLTMDQYRLGRNLM